MCQPCLSDLSVSFVLGRELESFLPGQLLIALAVLTLQSSIAQAPTGTIAGVVSDQSGAVISHARVTIGKVPPQLDLSSRLPTAHSACPLSPPAITRSRWPWPDSRRGPRSTVETGGTTTVDMRLQVGAHGERECGSRHRADGVRASRHRGVITQRKDRKPAAERPQFPATGVLEPGVTISPGTTSQYNALFSVSILGGDSQQDRHHGGRRQYPQRHRRRLADELLPGSGEGVPALGREFRSLHRHHQRGRDQRGHPQRRQRVPRQRLLLLPRSQHGGVSRAEAESARAGSVFRAPQSRVLGRRADQEGSPVLLFQLRVHEPDAGGDRRSPTSLGRRIGRQFRRIPIAARRSACASIISSRSSTCCLPAIRTTAITASVPTTATAAHRCLPTGCAITNWSDQSVLGLTSVLSSPSSTISVSITRTGRIATCFPPRRIARIASAWICRRCR